MHPRGLAIRVVSRDDVWERNARATAFYEKWGYAVDGEQDFLLGEDVQHDLLMARDVGSEPNG